MIDSTMTESPELPGALRGKRQLASTESFCFECHSGLECFKRCCSDINIMLTPTDVLALARRLEISTGEFLDKYTLTPITKDLHLPVVVLRMNDDADKNCSLLGEKGCSVYEDRPWSCRMYPVGMALPPARAGEKPEPQHYLFEDDFCDGHKEPQKWTVDAWREDQGLEQREKLEDEFQAIVSHPWFIGGRQLDPKRMQMFHMACYDLDTFRRFIFSSSFLHRFELKDELIESLKNDDEALLQFAYRWVRFALFGEPTMPLRGELEDPEEVS